MHLRRTLLVLLLAAASAFAPLAGMASAKACTGSPMMAASTSMPCGCDHAMPDCGTVAQCGTFAGCVGQCGAPALMAVAFAPEIATDTRISPSRDLLPSSFSLRPPSPPPRA